MYRYSVFGGCLASELEFPHLRPALDAMPDWTLRVTHAPSLSAHAEFLGEHQLAETIRLTVHRLEDGYRLHYSDAGTFDVTRHGREITWTPMPESTEEDARDCVIGRVFAAALHLAGRLVLHGSAVSIDDRAITFLAPPFHGKSTLALALTGAGARFITDDAVVVDPTKTPLVYPGVHSARLFGDSAGRLGRTENVMPGSLGKHVIAGLDEALLRDTPAPLDALYLLAPVERMSDGAAARRTRVTGLRAAAAVIGHHKAGNIFGHEAQRTIMSQAGVVAAATPVYTLAVVRDFARLDEVVAQLAAWHAAPRTENGATSAARAS